MPESATQNPSSPSDMDKVMDDLATLRADLGDLTESFVKAGKHKANKTYSSSVDSVNEYVMEKPMTALGAAFGAGIIAAVLFGRR